MNNTIDVKPSGYKFIKPYRKSLFQFFMPYKSKEKKRRIFFAIRAKNVASTVMRGYQMVQQLRRKGMDANVLDLNHNYCKAEEIKDSIVIFVKNAILRNNDLISILKKNKNIVIWDIVDCMIDQQNSILNFFKDNEPAIGMLDGVIYPNNKSKVDWHQHFKSDCLKQTIYHHWDPRLKPNRAKNFQLVYAGGPQNIDEHYVNSIGELHILEYKTDSDWRNYSAKMSNYNCHFSVRKEGAADFNYKSNAKLSTASATNSNIILTKDFSFTELLDNSYPYYIASNMKNVKEAVRHAKETYGTETWRKALAMMQEVREKTSIQRICEECIRFLNCF
jgi:hypothetical protein